MILGMATTVHRPDSANPVRMKVKLQRKLKLRPGNLPRASKAALDAAISTPAENALWLKKARANGLNVKPAPKAKRKKEASATSAVAVRKAYRAKKNVASKVASASVADALTRRKRRGVK